MKAILLILALLVSGCAIEPNGVISPFEGLDHGCERDPASCSLK